MPHIELVLVPHGKITTVKFPNENMNAKENTFLNTTVPRSRETEFNVVYFALYCYKYTASHVILHQFNN